MANQMTYHSLPMNNEDMRTTSDNFDQEPSSPVSSLHTSSIYQPTLTAPHASFDEEVSARPTHEPTTSPSSYAGSSNGQDKPSKLLSFKTRVSPRQFGWWWELGGIIVSVISMALIVAILASMHDKPLRTWKLPIQPNSLVAVFSTLSKSALLIPIAECISELKWRHFHTPQRLSHLEAFDEASRGPWGSITFLWRTKAQLLLPSIGAILTILALAFEPFTQQAFEFNSRDTIQDNTVGFASAAQIWHSPELVQDVAGGGGGGRLQALDSSIMLASAKAAMRQSTSIFTPPTPDYFCPTSRCTIPGYTSLGACASCDIVETMGLDGLNCSFNQILSSPLERSELASYLKKHNGTIDTIESNCELPADESDMINAKNYFLGDVCSAKTSMSASVMKGDEGNPGSINTISSIHQLPRLERGEPLRAGYFEYFKIETRNSSQQFNTNCTDTSTEIGRCRLDICAYHYEEGVIENDNRKPGGMTISSLKIINDKTTSEDFIDLQGLGEAYQVHNATFEALRTILVESSHDFMALGQSNARGFSTHIDWEIYLDVVAKHINSIIQGPRNTKATNQTATAYSAEIYVVIRWPWIVMPLLIVLLTIVFLALTITQAHAMPYLFKSSVLATIFHGLEGWSEDEIDFERHGGGRETKDVLMKKAQGIETVLERDNEGILKFRRSK